MRLWGRGRSARIQQPPQRARCKSTSTTRTAESCGRRPAGSVAPPPAPPAYQQPRSTRRRLHRYRNGPSRWPCPRGPFRCGAGRPRVRMQLMVRAPNTGQTMTVIIPQASARAASSPCPCPSRRACNTARRSELAHGHAPILAPLIDAPSTAASTPVPRRPSFCPPLPLSSSRPHLLGFRPLPLPLEWRTAFGVPPHRRGGDGPFWRCRMDASVCGGLLGVGIMELCRPISRCLSTPYLEVPYLYR